MKSWKKGLNRFKKELFWENLREVGTPNVGDSSVDSYREEQSKEGLQLIKKITMNNNDNNNNNELQ